MGAGANSGVCEAIRAATKSELKSVLPGVGEDREKLYNALHELEEAESHGSWNANEGRLRLIFDECDHDGSGDMDLQELTVALQRDEEMAREYGLENIVVIEHKDDIVAIFKAADRDLNGSLCWDEFYDMMTKLHNGELNHIISQVHHDETHSPMHSARDDGEQHMFRSSTLEDLVPSSRANVNHWRIDYWELDKKDKQIILLQAIKEWGCLSEITVPGKVLRDFMSGIQSRYLENPYHNFLHALATTHYVFRLVEASKLKDHITCQDRFALVVGALCHDVGHQGRNSAFEIITLSSMAIRYNDRSPLENHHCAIAFEVALQDSSRDLDPISPGGKRRISGSGQPERSASERSMTPTETSRNCNIFKCMDSDVFLHVRKRIIAGILGTDMSLHNHHVSKLKTFTTPTEFIESDGGEFLVELVMHAADIGNPFMPPDISYRWGQKIAEEFTAQVEDETRLGLPVTSMMSGLTDPKKNAKSRVGFIDFVVTPLATHLFELFPGLVEHAKNHLDENREAEKKRAAA